MKIAFGFYVYSRRSINKIFFYIDLAKLARIKFPDGGSVSIFSTAQAATKNDAQFKRGQNRLKNKQLALLI